MKGWTKRNGIFAGLGLFYLAQFHHGRLAVVSTRVGISSLLVSTFKGSVASSQFRDPHSTLLGVDPSQGKLFLRRVLPRLVIVLSELEIRPIICAADVSGLSVNVGVVVVTGSLGVEER